MVTLALVEANILPMKKITGVFAMKEPTKVLAKLIAFITAEKII